MKKIIKNILKEETNNSKLKLVKSLIHQLFDGVSFIEQSTYDNKPLLKVYFDSDDTAANIESWLSEEICDAIMEYSGNHIILCPHWRPNWDFRKKIVDFYIDAELLKYDNLGNVINEDYSPAGKEIIPNEIVVHKSNPIWRKNILETGLQVSVGECYKTYVGYGEKCVPAIFATNSTNKRAWFDSTYDDDVWFIDTKMIPDVKWYKDKHFESTKKHIVTFENIPPEALTLIYEGSGKGDEYVVKNIKESKDIEIEKNLKVINTLLSLVSWDGLCDIWAEYNPDDKEYEIRSKTTASYFGDNDIEQELESLENSIRSMGIRVYIYTPWYVENCEDEVKFMNESENKKSNYLDLIKDIVEPFKEVECICDIDTRHDDNMYSVYVVFSQEELNDKFTYDGQFFYIRKKTKEVKEAIESYLPIDNLYVGSYGKPNCGWKPLNESKVLQKENIKETDFSRDIKHHDNIQSDLIPKIQSVLNKTMSNTYDWWKGIEIYSLRTSGKPFHVLTLNGELTVDEEWGASQWGKYYDTIPFPGNDEGWEERGYKDEITLGDLTGYKDNSSENIKEDITSVINMTTNLGVMDMQLSTITLIFI